MVKGGGGRCSFAGEGVYTGMFRISPLLKSIVGMALDLARDSLTAESRIWRKGSSFSNFISVLVGWMLTSISEGLTWK